MASTNYQDNYQFLGKYLNDVLQSSNGPLYYFYQQLYNIPRNGIKFEHPDLSGYTLMFMQPPHLSGYGFSENYGGDFGDYCKFMCFAGVDFTPPSVQISPSDLPSRSGSINFATERVTSGQMSITFIDNQDSILFSFHKLWSDYIEDIIRGKNSRDGKDISPTSEYYKEDGERFGQLDYVTSAYVIRFKPSMNLGKTELNYIGKATGIFPISLPDKEEIGRRDSPELITLPMSYACTFYRQRSPFGAPKGDQHDYLYSEFASFIQSVFSG